MLTTVMPLDEFPVPLIGGAELSIWAHGYSRVPGELIFMVLADVALADQTSLRLAGRSPSDPCRVDVVVATVPTSLLEGDWWHELTEWPEGWEGSVE